MKWLKNDGKKVIPGIIMMLVMGTVYSYSVFRLPIEDQFQVARSLSGFPYMISLLFYALFMFVSGHILEKVPAYRVMLIGILLISFGWMISFLSSNLFVLTLGYGVFIGSGIGLIYGIPLMIIAEEFPKKKGLYMGLILLGFGLSPFVTAPLLQELVYLVGLSMTFLFMSIISLVILFVLSLFYKSYNQKQIKDESASVVKTIKLGQFRLLFVLFFLATFIGLSVIGFTSTYAYESLNYSLIEAAFFVSFFAIFNGLGRVVYGYLMDRIDITIVIGISFILLIFSSLLNILFNDFPLIFIVTFMIYWFNLGGWLAIAPIATSILFGRKSYAKTYGVLFSAYGLSAIFGVYMTGYLLEQSENYQSTFILFFGLSLIGLILVVFFNKSFRNINV